MQNCSSPNPAIIELKALTETCRISVLNGFLEVLIYTEGSELLEPAATGGCGSRELQQAQKALKNKQRASPQTDIKAKRKGQTF